MLSWLSRLFRSEPDKPPWRPKFVDRETRLLDTEPWKKHQPGPDADPPEDSDRTWDELFNRPITDLLRFEITYKDRRSDQTIRVIEPKMIHLLARRPECYIRAYCHLRQEERTFYSDNIVDCTNLQTNRKISDLGQYLRGKY